MQKTKTRKTKLVVAMAIILCLAFTAAMGGFTYAKYVSSQTMDAQSATVAKWGYVVNIQATELFGDAYGTTAGTKIAYSTTGNTVGVKASAEGTNLVAPGTTGSMTFSIKGSAEVRAKIVVDVLAGYKTVQLKQGETVAYEPIKWTLKKGETAVVTDVTMANLVSALEGLSKEAIEPNSAAIDDTYTLSWAWAFESGNDENDTRLGLIKAGETVDGYTADTDVSFGMKISVEQIQGADA